MSDESSSTDCLLVKSYWIRLVGLLACDSKSRQSRRKTVMIVSSCDTAFRVMHLIVGYFQILWFLRTFCKSRQFHQASPPKTQYHIHLIQCLSFCSRFYPTFKMPATKESAQQLESSYGEPVKPTFGKRLAANLRKWWWVYLLVLIVLVLVIVLPM